MTAIRNDMFNTLEGDEPGLAMYWSVEKSPTGLIDLTGNGNTGTLVGSDWFWFIRAWTGGATIFSPKFTNGLYLDANIFVLEDGDDVTVYEGPEPFGITRDGTPADVAARWSKYWYLTVDDEGWSEGDSNILTLGFHSWTSGMPGAFDPTLDYYLLMAPADGGEYVSVPILSVEANELEVLFDIIADDIGPGLNRVTLGYTVRRYLPLIPTP